MAKIEDGPRRAESAHSVAVPYLLINPPLTDPTVPYHSIAYLVSSTRRAGFNQYECLDANIAALNYLSQPQQVAALLRRAHDLRAGLEERIAARADPRQESALCRGEEISYRRSLAAEGLEKSFVSAAVAVMRDPVRFYDYQTYRDAAQALRRWLVLLGIASPLARYEDFQLTAPIEFMTVDDLADGLVTGEITAPMRPYLDGPYREVLRKQDWAVIGFSVNFTSQLPFALEMARRARAECPNAVILFGGTEVCDSWKCARSSDDFWRVFATADAIVPGEGEAPLVAVLTAVRDGGGLDGIRGVAAYGTRRGTERVNYEDLRALPTPAYDIWDWTEYWSPEPIMLYSPTRGCYWNKCTFCDYGLNDGLPTSPARSRPAGQVIDDLREMTQIGRTVYFSVDAMSPRYVRSLAAAIADHGLNIRWSAELRLERTFPKMGVGRVLADSGCVSVSFGYESGSQRILDLINKGVRISEVDRILADLAEHDIGAQMMGFTGFPGETELEARETYDYLISRDHLWALAGIGSFQLTPGAIIARDPSRFGVEVLDVAETQVIKRMLPWRDTATGVEHWPDEVDGRVPTDLRRKISRDVGRRPFVGGIDTGHTILYFDRFGRGLLPQGQRRKPRRRLAVGACLFVPISGSERLAGGKDMFSAGSCPAGQTGDWAGWSYASWRRWLAEPGQVSQGRTLVGISPAGEVIGVPEVSEQLTDAKVAVAIEILMNSRG